MEPKKNTVLRVLQLLERFSDGNHRLGQQQICDLLLSEYGIKAERKAVARNLTALSEAGYRIERGRKGIWLKERTFSDGELKVLIDNVLATPCIDGKHTSELVEKLKVLGGDRFCTSHRVEREGYSFADTAVTEAIELLDSAVAEGKKVKFVYNTLNLGGRTVPCTKTLTVEPTVIFFREGRYYLICRDGSRYRVDGMSRLEKAEKTEISKVGDRALTELFDGKTERTVVKMEKSLYPVFAERFGTDGTVEELTSDTVKASFDAPNGKVLRWAMTEEVEVLAPKHLRTEIERKARRTMFRYRSDEEE